MAPATVSRDGLTRRAHLRRALERHVADLGYSCVHAGSAGEHVPEIVRVSPTRGHVAYGETVLRADLGRKRCRERLLAFSQHRTRRRSSILFFIAVPAEDRDALEALLAKLEIRSGFRGGHVHVVPVAVPRNRPRV